MKKLVTGRRTHGFHFQNGLFCRRRNGEFIRTHLLTFQTAFIQSSLWLVTDQMSDQQKKKNVQNENTFFFHLIFVHCLCLAAVTVISEHWTVWCDCDVLATVFFAYLFSAYSRHFYSMLLCFYFHEFWGRTCTSAKWMNYVIWSVVVLLFCRCQCILRVYFAPHTSLIVRFLRWISVERFLSSPQQMTNQFRQYFVFVCIAIGGATKKYWKHKHEDCDTLAHIC